MRQSVEVLSKISPCTWETWKRAVQQDCRCKDQHFLDWEITAPMYNCVAAGVVKESKAYFTLVGTLNEAYVKITKYVKERNDGEAMRIADRKKALLNDIENTEPIELKKQLEKLAVNTTFVRNCEVWEILELLLEIE